MSSRSPSLRLQSQTLLKTLRLLHLLANKKSLYQDWNNLAMVEDGT